MKKFISILLSVILAATAFIALPLTANAAETTEQPVGQRYYGTTFGCEWELGTISGEFIVRARNNANGEMEDYFSDTQPWYSKGSYITTVTIEDGVKHIGDYSFFNMNTINSLYIGNTVKSIGYSAFKGCSLDSVTIPGSVETINDSAFANCGLTSVTFFEGVESIDNRAFDNNANLTQVVVPPTVTSIGPQAFGYVDGQKIEGFTIYGYTGSKAEKYANNYGFNFVEVGEYSGISGDCTWRFDPSTGIFTVDGNGNMADYPIYGAPWYEYHDDITKVVIGNRVASVGDSSFYFCRNLTEVTLGYNIKTIGDSAFAFCDLRSVVTPDITHTIKDSAFFNNRNLATVTFGEQLKVIGPSAFERTALTSVKFKKNLEKIDQNAFTNCKLSEVTIPDNVTIIGEKAFGYNSVSIDNV